MLLLNSTNSLRKLRNLCSRLNKRLGNSHGQITEKNLHISQLEEAVKHLGAKVESTTDEAERKSKDVAELHLKLNENYRLVAELSSDNLRLSTEKAAAEELLDEVKHEQSLLKKDLGKAQKVLEGTMAAQGGNFQENWQMRPRQSSPETSASSFDFFPTASSSSISANNSRSNQWRRGSIPPRGRQKSNRNWKSGANSDYASVEIPASPRKRSNSRSNATTGNVPASDVSSPDLGVDLGSDPFSSLERTNDISLVQQLGRGNPSIVAMLEENKRLKQDKERLAEKLSQSKGALRETLDRLHKKDASTLSPLPSRRIFSSAVAAAVSNQPPPSLKEEFLAFSKSHRFKGNKQKKSSNDNKH